MKVAIPSLVLLALAGGSAASAAAPYTLKDLDAARTSVLAQLAAEKPKTTVSTTLAKTSEHASTFHTKPRTTPTTTVSTHHAVATPKAAAAAKTSDKHERRDLISSIIGLITNIPIPNVACAMIQNWGFSYMPTVTSPAGFLNDTTMYTSAMAASAPAGYVWNWAGLLTAVVSPYYLGYAQLTSYNVSACAAYCNATTGCQAFDMYYERDPTVWPGVTCMNPSMQVGIHCALYGAKLNATTATNIGQWNGNFAVVITGANGYSKVNATSVPAVVTTPAVSIVSNFTIQSAYFADQNITALAQQNFLVNGQLVVNTSYPSAALGADPWPANTAKTITILYTYNGEARVFNAVENTGVYTQLAASYSTTSAPGASLLTNFLPTNGASFNIVAVTYGGVQITSTSVYAALYVALWTGLPFVVSDFNLGLGVSATSTSTKTLVIWYKSGSSSNIQTLTARQSLSLTASLS